MCYYEQYMERLRSSGKGPEKKYYEHERLGRFEIEEVRVLKPSDIGNIDRAFIQTESGNRYMIRHSESRGGSLVIYNERESAFKSAGAHPFLIRQNTIAEVGLPLNILVEDEKEVSKTEWRSTPITRIEIRRGVETAIRDAAKGRGHSGFGAVLAEAIKEQVRGPDTSEPEETDPLNHFKG
jgi:hypothetical protein